jgi:hypothetical protein
MNLKISGFPCWYTAPCFVCNESMICFREWTMRRPPKNAALDPFPKPPRSMVSPSMSLLQGYYGLALAPERDPADEATEMAMTNKGKIIIVCFG